MYLKLTSQCGIRSWRSLDTAYAFEKADSRVSQN